MPGESDVHAHVQNDSTLDQYRIRSPQKEELVANAKFPNDEMTGKLRYKFSHFLHSAPEKRDSAVLTVAMGVSSDDTITSRLFKILRIERMLDGQRSGTNNDCVSIDESEVATREVPLKPHETPRSTSKRSRIQFNSVVTVISIPSHAEYSDGIKKFIWANSAEIKLNAQRNRREFAAEGWKWENAVEEDEMYFDKCSKERIHPVHLGGIMDLR